jgi:hypothetical protein
MSSQRKSLHGNHSLDSRFTPLVHLLAEVRLRIEREAQGQGQGKKS